MIGGTNPVQFLRDVHWSWQRTHGGGKRPKRFVLAPAVAARLEKLVGHVPEVTRLRFDADGALVPSQTIAVFGVPVVVDVTLTGGQGWADGEDPGCG
jgi:hypothetical protein